MVKDILNKLKATPLWLALPSILVVGAVVFAMEGYEPLVFDPSLYPAQQAQAAELKTVDASAVEKEATPAVVAEEAADTAAGVLQDGTWTGYAACGEGNADDWKPYYVAVTITVSGGQVTAITGISGTSTGGAGSSKLDWDAEENQKYLDWAIDGRNQDEGVKRQLVVQLPTSGSFASIDTVSGATYSSTAIYNALVDARNRAAQAGGATTTSAKTASVKTKAKAAAKTAKKVKKAAKVGKLADGTWTAYAPCGVGNEDDWKPYYVGVTITVKGGKVTSVKKVYGSSKGETGSKSLNWDAAENQSYLTWAADGRTRAGKKYTGVVAQIKAAIKKAKTSFAVDAVSGATYSSEAIYNAYFAALKKSAVAAGSKVKTPAQAVKAPETTAPGNVAAQEEGMPSIFGNFADGTYTGHAFCKDLDDPGAYSPYYVLVSVQAQGGQIISIGDIDGDAAGEIDPAYRYYASENFYYLDRAINGYGLHTKGVQYHIQTKLDAGEEIGDIDTVSGATWSSKSILEAFAAAVRNAQASAK